MLLARVRDRGHAETWKGSWYLRPLHGCRGARLNSLVMTSRFGDGGLLLGR